MNTIDLPSITAEEPAEQLEQLKRYLFRIIPELNTELLRLTSEINVLKLRLEEVSNDGK